MLEALEPDAARGDLLFPTLRDRNLFAADFFGWAGTGRSDRFDVIAGNPPWRSLTPAARRYVADRDLPIARNQIAQAFFWKTLNSLNPQGRAALLLPSRTTLFANGASSIRFRTSVFQRADVRLVLDLSDFQSKLFAHAKQPAVVMIFGQRSSTGTAKEPTGPSVVEYWAPHRSPRTEVLPGLVVSGDEIHRVSTTEAHDHPYIWKTLGWAGAADYAFIKTLKSSHTTLAAIADDQGWVMGEGIQIGGGDARPSLDLQALPFIEAAGLRPLEASLSEPLGAENLHRTRRHELFTWPVRLLIAEGTDFRRGLSAAVVDQPAVFGHRIVSIASSKESDRTSLRCLAAVFNSSLARYVMFLTSGQWGVERGALEMQDIATFPCPDLHSTGQSEIRRQLVSIDAGSADWRERLDGLIYRLYDVSTAQRALIDDVLEGALERYAQYGAYDGFGPVSLEQLGIYASTLGRLLRATLGDDFATFQPLRTLTHQGYSLVSLRLAGTEESLGTRQIEPLKAALGRITTAWSSGPPRAVYIRRNGKIVDRDAVHILKPSESRYWTVGTAYRDADDVLLSLIRPTSNPLTAVSAAG